MVFSGKAKADFAWGSDEESVMKKFPNGSLKCNEDSTKCHYVSFQKMTTLKEGILVRYMFQNHALTRVMWVFTPPSLKMDAGPDELAFLNQKQTDEVMAEMTGRLSSVFGAPKASKNKEGGLMIYWMTQSSTILLMEVCGNVGTTPLPCCQPILIFSNQSKE